MSFSNGYFPKTTAESMLKFDRWCKTTLFPWYKLRYLISSAKHYAVYKHKAFPPQIQIELTLLLKTNPCMYSNLCLHPSVKKYTVLIQYFPREVICRAQEIRLTFDFLFNANIPYVWIIYMRTFPKRLGHNGIWRFLKQVFIYG